MVFAAPCILRAMLIIVEDVLGAVEAAKGRGLMT
jgi:hypothetical protein